MNAPWRPIPTRLVTIFVTPFVTPFVSPFATPLVMLFPMLFAIGAVDATFADGKFFRRLEVADEPGIQAQRAVVAFRDGVETLIVQSDVDGSDTAYGWLLPLPAEPTSIEPCQANSLNALVGVVQPEVVGYPNTILILSFALSLLLIAACLDHLHRRASGPVRTSPTRILLFVFVVQLVAFFLLPTLSAGRGAAAVDVLQTVKAGVYDVTVIKGETGEAVQEWLTANGFASPPAATAILKDYAADDWCILAAKVSAEARGTASHHPLKVTFPAERAVYPLRLTGADGDPILLDLFVIAERRAAARVMRTWVCDYYDRDSIGAHRLDKYACATPPIFQSRTRPFSRVGIPAVSALMWPGCVVTRLHGRLDADDMEDDLFPRWIDPTPTRATLYSLGGAVGWSGSIALIVVALAFAWFTRTAVKRGWSWRTAVRRRMLVAVGLGLCAGGARYAMLEVVPVQSDGGEWFRSIVAVSAHQSVLMQLVEDPPAKPFPEAYRDLLAAARPGESLSGVSDLRKPGDYTIEPAEDGWRLTIIDRPYIPITISITPDGRPRMLGDGDG